MTAGPGPDVSVVLPVRDAGHLVDGCLRSLLPEVAAHGAELVVVDDASSDDTARRVTSHDGPRLLAHARPRGPYAARETGWRASHGQVVAFVDVRCRVAPGWLAALVAAATRPGVAVAGAGYHVTPGRTVAARAAALQDGFRPAASLEDATLPFLPGGNLAVRRDVLEAVGGFDTGLSSGGDLVLCWAVQVAGLGSVVLAPGARVAWVPRDRVRDLVRQRAKYGRHRVAVELRVGDVGTPPALPPTFPLATQVAEAVRRHREAPDHGIAVHVAIAIAEYAHHRAYRSAYLRAAADGLVPPARSRARAVRDRLVGR